MGKRARRSHSRPRAMRSGRCYWDQCSKDQGETVSPCTTIWVVGYCAQCASGNLMWCGEASGYGGPVDGSHADYIIADERNCVKMPGTMRFTDGAFIACPAGTAYSSLSKLEVRPRDNVAGFGLGPVGLSSIILATAMGGNIIRLDIIDERLKLAKQVGAAAVSRRGKERCGRGDSCPRWRRRH